MTNLGLEVSSGFLCICLELEHTLPRISEKETHLWQNIKEPSQPEMGFKVHLFYANKGGKLSLVQGAG